MSGLDRETFESRLAEAFGGTATERRVVARMAGDLADAGRYERDTGVALTAAEAVDHLADAPAHEGDDEADAPSGGAASEGAVAARWNWWMGSLSLAYGGYDRFRVDEWDRE